MTRLRQALRAGTAEAHQALDALWSGRSLADRDHYVRFLDASAAALLPIEAGLAASGVDTLLPDWPRRRRTDAIVADLAGFGRAAPEADPVGIDGEPAMLGTLYVLEGSRLGGAMLLREAQDSPDPAVRANMNYLRHGQGDGLWRSFLARLDAAEPGDAELAAMIAGARDAFARFGAAARRSSLRWETI